MNVAVDVRGLFYQYPTGKGITDISFTVDAGEVVCIFGWNGAGKTTLLKVLSTLVSPQTGSYQVCGSDVTINPESVRNKIFPVFDTNAHFNNLTGRENALLFLSLYGVSQQKSLDRIAGDFDLDLDQLAGEYSLGMKRKLLLIESFVAGKEVLIFDEPTLGLDSTMRPVFFNYVQEAVKAGSCVIIGTNRLEDASSADRILLLNKGILNPATSVEALIAGMIRVTITLEDRELVEHIPSIDELPQLIKKILTIGIPRRIDIENIMTGESVYWTDEADEKIRRAPPFIQAMIRSLVERYAVDHGLSRITPDVVDTVKERFEMR